MADIKTDNFENYSRQVILPFIGLVGQKKLGESHIVVVGCGGLGCPLLLYLAASGIGKITIIDNDIISQSNLHRQILFSYHDIGQFKVNVATKKLTYLYPDIDIIPIKKRLDTKLARDICADADLVIDGTDSFLSKYILSEICPVFLTASVVGMTGYIAGFTQDASYRTFFPEIPNNAPNCSQTGVLGSVAGLIGTFLATEAIKILLKHTDTVIHKMITLDLNTLHFTKIQFSKNLNIIHHKLPQFDYVHLSDKPSGTIIDIREPDELIDNPLIENSLSMPLSQFNIDDFLGVKSPILKCHTGRRAERLALKIGLSTNKLTHIKIMTS